MELKNFTSIKSIQILTKNSNRILILIGQFNVKYLTIPVSISIKEFENRLHLNLVDPMKKKELKALELKIRRFDNAFNTSYKKKIMLKGLGFRVNFVEDSRSLVFKVGYSHLVLKKIPKGINIKATRTTVTAESFNKVLLGNFMDYLRNIRLPDGYKGKGIWSKYQQKKLKVVKKK